MKETIVFLVGPTATGKSEVAVRLAKKINGEIVSCDSMQVYKGMDIITSKPPSALRRLIPHYLIGVIPLNKEYNVSCYYKDTASTIKKILKQGKTPIVVGGSGLYMSILIDGIFQSGTSSNVMRNRLYGKAQKMGGKYLFNRLQKIDPAAARRIHPHDTKRIIRALEVFEATGQPISKLQQQRRGLGQEYRIKAFCLNLPRQALYQRIDARVEKMFIKGLVREVRRLLKLKLSKTARLAIGIRELRGYFDGVYSLDEAKRLIKRNTRQYAKRQLTWFRKDKRLEWIKVGEKEKPASVANRVFKALGTPFRLISKTSLD